MAEALRKECYDFTAKEGEVRQKSVWEMMDSFTSIGSKSGLIGGKIRDSVFRIIVSRIYYVFSMCLSTILSALHNSFMNRCCYCLYFQDEETEAEMIGNLPKDHTLSKWQSQDANLYSLISRDYHTN